MIQIGTITGRTITPNKDGDIDRVMLQVEMSSPDDIQTVELISLPGQDENPINGSRVYIMEVGTSYKVGIAVNGGVVPSIETGEKSLYATNDAGALQCFIDLLKTGEIDIVGVAASIILLNSGIIELNGSADFAVRFNALQSKLTALEAQLLAHVHPGVTAGGASTGISVTVFDIDITTAKVAEVKLP